MKQKTVKVAPEDWVYAEGIASAIHVSRSLLFIHCVCLLSPVGYVCNILEEGVDEGGETACEGAEDGKADDQPQHDEDGQQPEFLPLFQKVKKFSKKFHGGSGLFFLCSVLKYPQGVAVAATEQIRHT